MASDCAEAIIRLWADACLGAQSLYLPALLLRVAVTVADGGDANLDLTLIQARPEPEVPTVLLKQLFVPEHQKPDASSGCTLSSIWKSSSSQDIPTYYAPTTRKFP